MTDWGAIRSGWLSVFFHFWLPETLRPDTPV